jgi:hypothetical protein
MAQGSWRCSRPCHPRSLVELGGETRRLSGPRTQRTGWWGLTLPGRGAALGEGARRRCDRRRHHLEPVLDRYQVVFETTDRVLHLAIRIVDG